MPRFEPFRALRYADSATELDDLIAPPYDVLSEAQVAELKRRSDHNIAHLDDPRGGDERYRTAAELLTRWRADGALITDPEPTFTIYRLSFTDATGSRRQISGVLGGLEVLDPGTEGSTPAGRVLPHERTTRKASTDRLELTRATRANLSPVWGLSLAAGLSDLLAAPGELVGEVVDGGVDAAGRDDRVVHRVERVDDPERIAAIRRLLAGDDVLIADGHHRYQVSREYRDEVRSGAAEGSAGGADAPAEQTLAFVNELSPDQLSVEAIHRLYRGIGIEALRGLLDTRFERSPLPGLGPDTLASMEVDGFLVLVGPEGAEKLSPRPGAFDGVRALDGLWLEETLSPSVVPAALEVGYQHGLDQVTAAIADGTAAAAVLIRPVSVAEIERTAREGLLMPPKSTFFTPKLKTGFVIRSLAAET